MFRKVFRHRYDYHEFEASKIPLSKEKSNKGFSVKEIIRKKKVYFVRANVIIGPRCKCFEPY